MSRTGLIKTARKLIVWGQKGIRDFYLEVSYQNNVAIKPIEKSGYVQVVRDEVTLLTSRF